jgi:hypothetical protein
MSGIQATGLCTKLQWMVTPRHTTGSDGMAQLSQGMESDDPESELD